MLAAVSIDPGTSVPSTASAAVAAAAAELARQQRQEQLGGGGGGDDDLAPTPLEGVAEEDKYHVGRCVVTAHALDYSRASGTVVYRGSWDAERPCAVKSLRKALWRHAQHDLAAVTINRPLITMHD